MSEFDGKMRWTDEDFTLSGAAGGTSEEQL